MTHRFIRTEMLLGKDGLRRLQHAHVVVAGMGAVGSYAVEALVRAGIGHLRLVDFDVVRTSNLNRQLYALESTLGRAKVEIAAARVRDINPACHVEALRLFIDDDTMDEVLKPPVDVVVDAIDSLGPKVRLLAACVGRSLPVVSCMGAATRTDPKKIHVADIAKTDMCPLAKLVRKNLRQRGIVKGVTCVFSTELPPAPDGLPDEAVCDAGEREDVVRGRVRRPLGSLSCMTGMFGLLAAHRVIMDIVKAEKAG